MTAHRDSTDEALARAAAAGGTGAFDVLVHRHTPRMYRVAVRVVGDAGEAEDVVQDAWVAAWRSLHRFRGDARLSTWLYRVVTNTALAHLRRRHPTVPLDEVTAGGALCPEALTQSAAHGPEQRALRSERIGAVLAAVHNLEPSQRVPIVLHELEGLSYEEVAAVLDVGIPALRSRLHRARVALLAQLRELR